MAKKALADFKASLQLAVDEINVSLADTLQADQMANEWRGGYCPMRKIENLFVLDQANGHSSANSDYIEKAYNGKIPTYLHRRMKKLEPFTP